MSKFKVGDKVRRKLDYVNYGDWSYGRDTLIVSKTIGFNLSVGSDPEYRDSDKFELVEEVKPAPLIDGPGLYRTRNGSQVEITGLRPATDFGYDGSCLEHVWIGVDAEGCIQCYRPSGSWEVKEYDTGPYDLVEKISGTLEFIPDEPRAYEQCPANPEVVLRQFTSGATRNLDTNKYDYEGFLSPLVIEAFGKYMHSHRLQKDGKMRDSSNWKKGIPDEVYMKSMWRHFFDVWKLYSGHEVLSPEDGHSVNREEALCAVLFNVQGMLHEILKHSKDRPVE